MKTKAIGHGRVESLAVNGESVISLRFELDGPLDDRHSGYTRALSGHDTGYIMTSRMTRGQEVFNTRSWTGLSREEVEAVQETMGVKIPVGCLLENIVISDVQDFSKLPPTSRLVFHREVSEHEVSQAVLVAFEENTPCSGVGNRLAAHYHRPELSKQFNDAARGKRGMMGFVLSAGWVEVGDYVSIYPPLRR